MEDGISSVRKLLLLSLIFTMVLYCVSSVTAPTTVKLTEIRIVTGTGLPSATDDLPYKYYTVSFIDQCPLCGASDCLEWNPKGVDEGEWTCKYCKADYCAVTGRDKSYYCRATLIRIDK